MNLAVNSYNLELLTGNEGGKMMCLGELFNVPTAMTAFTGMVNIWGPAKKQQNKT